MDRVFYSYFFNLLMGVIFIFVFFINNLCVFLCVCGLESVYFVLYSIGIGAFIIVGVVSFSDRLIKVFG